jgi:hypothetical protein
MTPVPNLDGPRLRGVVAEGPVGTRWAGHFRVFRYEIRRWPDGVIPDLQFAISSPVRITDDERAAQLVLDPFLGEGLGLTRSVLPRWRATSFGSTLWNSLRSRSGDRRDSASLPRWQGRGENHDKRAWLAPRVAPGDDILSRTFDRDVR